MRIFNISDILDAVIESIRSELDGYTGYNYVATESVKANELRDELYRTQFIRDDEED